MHVREAGVATILRCHRVANFYYPSVVHTCIFLFLPSQALGTARQFRCSEVTKLFISYVSSNAFLIGLVVASCLRLVYDYYLFTYSIFYFIISLLFCLSYS